ncbi:MAG: bifunctional glutamate N-acetyltransferase/amino-acid acetyltransferase ArgJ [Alphaproteobacteria bacterium]|nr:bifunctional glutamate N-acetyltransferase/amino-acid acetyltransferase ArgJ [Alphaproteobacteria bacterium]MBU6473804.1 bifunctional glutamate N-acetyltransferase/amino-acid acetyltransferase ArgJ [Alphaproteobacteria bacterium]MDE2014786.1 bifunctional glutamate N-acetyltransferase/amino-acid acetyltransferase ArgJ [Alphaproteobacteria bacterium]MDE2075033.1 bifunctional glutamate N-acetyltransferase/amino-acid acetyltransferase ArgJ [Alphaproteobacteria bacterium]MDE2352751.1 bifunctional
MAKAPSRTTAKRKAPVKAKAKPQTAAAAHPVSPLAPRSFAKLPPLAGVRLATGAAGIKYKDRTDVLVAVLAPETQAAGVFTRSKTASAPVEWCRAGLAGGTARALVVNSGNANAFTGKAGMDGAQAVAQSTAAAVGCRAAEVFLASTGVIGEPLPAERITKILGGLVEAGAAAGWMEAARAIMTTDTYPKLATATAMIDGHKVTINGIAKGSGMIAPDMATMLSFVFTDAAIPAEALQEMLSAGVKSSFNAITVDSDTSTSDTLLLFATGKGARHPEVRTAADKRLAEFRRKLEAVLLDLALQVVRDGEGAQKLIQIDVTGAETDRAAHRVGLAIANSPLVKTAIAGSDANWGRVVMAVGKAGEKADRDRLRISFGGHVVAEKGERAAGYDEKSATKAVSGRLVEIAVDLGIGKGKARVWTCDLTHGYIEINGSYRS